jgi:hypothetical protein
MDRTQIAGARDGLQIRKIVANALIKQTEIVQVSAAVSLRPSLFWDVTQP